MDRRTVRPPQKAVPIRSAQTIRAFAAVGIQSAARLELTVKRENGRVSSHKLVHDGDHVRIGSHESNDLVLADPMVSRFHCSLTQHNQHWRVEDNGSLNGTWVSGVSVRDADLPRKGCIFELGNSAVKVCELPSERPEVLHGSNTLGGLHGSSPSMRKLFALIEQVAASDANVLIEGESGCGKELVATEIFRRGARSEKPLIVVDCGAISPGLFESKLFGHCRGAYTGATRDQVGVFEAASGGTVFLDEIGEMPLDLQPKLLRVLQARALCRVGETRSRPVDVRVVAATNRRLEREVNRGTFREDLFFRLSVITIRVPPLRERLEDLPLLISAILESLGASQASGMFGGEILSQLAQHHWPGNVRELRNYIERAIVLNTAEHTGLDQAPSSEDFFSPDGNNVVARVNLGIPLRMAKEQLVSSFETKYIQVLLEWADGNISRAARKAGMDRINLHRLIQRYGLRSSRLRQD